MSPKQICSDGETVIESDTPEAKAEKAKNATVVRASGGVVGSKKMGKRADGTACMCPVPGGGVGFAKTGGGGKDGAVGKDGAGGAKASGKDDAKDGSKSTASGVKDPTTVGTGTRDQAISKKPEDAKKSDEKTADANLKSLNSGDGASNAADGVVAAGVVAGGGGGGDQTTTGTDGKAQQSEEEGSEQKAAGGEIDDGIAPPAEPPAATGGR